MADPMTEHTAPSIPPAPGTAAAREHSLQGGSTSVWDAPLHGPETTIAPPSKKVPDTAGHSLGLLDLTRWGSPRTVSISRLAIEIALYGDDVDRLAAAYGLSVEAYHTMRNTCAVLEQEVAEARKSIEGKDRTGLKFRDICEQNLGMLASILADDSVEPRDRLKAFELAAKYAGLEPAKIESGGGNAQVNFNIVGVPNGFRVGKEVIDVESAAKRRDVEEKRLLKRADDLDREAAIFAETAIRDNEDDEGEESPFD